MVEAALRDLSRAARAASCAPVVGGDLPARREAAQAQIDLAARRTTGKLLLDPTR